MKKLGLVLAGGGGKGAYQIGVWKYLKEIGLDKKVSVVSGTSVGALNATLFASVPYEKAEYIWLHEIKGKILKPQIKMLLPTIAAFFNPIKILPLFNIISNIIKNGIFSREGLTDIIDRYVDFGKLKKTKLKIYATCCKIPSFKAKSFFINNKQPCVAKKILCATSAIPIVFKPEVVKTYNNPLIFLQIGDDKYIDGGVVDNIPCSPAIDKEGCSDIIIVNLDSKEKSGKYSQNNINYIYITPSKDLGNVFDGMLDFSESGAKHRIELGYDDCKKLYASLLDDLNSEKEFHS